MGPCIVEIDRIVIREVQYQFKDNRCRNEEIIFRGSSANSVGGDSGLDGRTDRRMDGRDNHNIPTLFKKRGDKFCVGVAYYGRGAPGLVMGPYIVEIGRIVIRDVQYQFEVNRCRNEEIIVKGNFGWAWPMAMHKVWYPFEVNRCRNEEIIVKGNFVGRGLCGRGAPGLVMGPCIVEINCIVVREVQYQCEVNRCRNEEIIVKGNFRWALPMWAWPMWAGRPRIDRIVIREVQYQFQVNRCRNEEIIVKGNFGWAWPMWAGRPRIDRIVIREAQYQFEVNRCRNEEVNCQCSSAIRRTDGQTHITTISPLFLRKTWG
ncbi:hypothetical protein DPMN_115146 [Dreissena polymorpha]|uniref:Uncharacterized protein n=1 Tax=Dreissena polymorpha TaxID=45954 RepID=A0A9D4KKR2_DREPO|nr:hypothetical protein DPMN_115146 [Dreissena polymorpha]